MPEWTIYRAKEIAKMDYEHTPPIRRITVTRLPHSGGKVCVKLPDKEIVLTRQEAMTLCNDLFVAADETEPAA
jgi:hypothetical protein